MWMGTSVSDSFRVELPWPPRILSPNGRGHWSPKAKATRQARTDASIVTMSALWSHTKPDVTGDIPMTWTFHPPRKGRFDRDNAIARCKALQDGIADALGVDDSRFVPTYRMGEPIKGGKVIVEIA
jgi:crossover junction endodeoxyribonuclease RusA